MHYIKFLYDGKLTAIKYLQTLTTFSYNKRNIYPAIPTPMQLWPWEWRYDPNTPERYIEQQRSDLQRNMEKQSRGTIVLKEDHRIDFPTLWLFGGALLKDPHPPKPLQFLENTHHTDKYGIYFLTTQQAQTIAEQQWLQIIERHRMEWKMSRFQSLLQDISRSQHWTPLRHVVSILFWTNHKGYYQPNWIQYADSATSYIRLSAGKQFRYLKYGHGHYNIGLAQDEQQYLPTIAFEGIWR